MKNLEHYKRLIRLLGARLVEMEEEKRLVNELLSIYLRQIKELEFKT